MENTYKKPEPIYRNKLGKKIDLKLEALKRKAEDHAKDEQIRKEMEWGQGLKQKQDKEARLEELEKMKSVPFARSADDNEMNRRLKEELRWDDPMRYEIQKTIKKNTPDEKNTIRSLATYQGYGPPNRFNIAPGSKWDGVDRSNGFESKLLQARASKIALKNMAYKWSSEDM